MSQYDPSRSDKKENVTEGHSGFHGDSEAKGARCPATTVMRKVLAVSLWLPSGEGCSLSMDETLGRRLNIPMETIERRCSLSIEETLG